MIRCTPLVLLLACAPALAQDGRIIAERESFPITLRAVGDADFAAMRAKNAALEQETAHRLGVTPDAPGSAERTYVQANGDVLELVSRVVPVRLEDFLAAVQPELWGPSLADYRGGQVRALGGGRQVERMVLRAPFKDLDMTKVEEVVRVRGPEGRVERAIIYWEVLRSDNGSVVRDVGSIRFAREGAGTRITSHSAHRLGVFPFRSRWMPESFKRSLTGWQLKRYFRKVGQNYGLVAQRGLLHAIPQERR